MRKTGQHGFTLIELAIVLVIIGLIVGGIMVGQSLINAATVRAQITQIEKFNQAVNTFKSKYGFLPGDMPQTAVQQFGFTAGLIRTGSGGRGDGNGILQASDSGVPICWGSDGELAWFWEDLSTNSQLIEGSFSSVADGGGITITGNANFSSYAPAAKIGGGNYILVSSVNGLNYFSLVFPTSVTNNSGAGANVGLTVNQAYGIDRKVDDGLPISGTVQAKVSAVSVLTGSNGTSGFNLGAPPTGGFVNPSAMSSASPSIYTCYDTTSNQYSVTENGGAGVNCALSFQFQ